VHGGGARLAATESHGIGKGAGDKATERRVSDWGVFAVARDIWDHPVLCSDEPFTKREAWMWLVSAAAWKPYSRGIGGLVVHLERGEFCYSIRFLQLKWKWKPGRVERFLKTLKKHDMIRDTERDSTKVYCISNYNDYQVVGLPERDTERDSTHDTTATGARQERDKEETFKHSNIQNKPITPSKRSRKLLNGHQSDFEAFYEAYPKKVDRGDAERAYLKALKLATPEQLLGRAQVYAAARAGKDPEFTKAPATWLNKKSWLDEIAPSATGPPNPSAEYAAKFAALEKK
jgi:hypothetical protein